MPKPKRSVIRDDGVRYESTSAAAKAVAGDQTNISRACRTGRKAYGHLWGYADEGSFRRFARLLAVRDSMDEPYAQASESTMLKSCPFCGGKPYVQTFESEAFAESRVVCRKCHVSTSREYSGGRTTWEPTGEDLTRWVAIDRAIKAWNLRHESPYRFPANRQAAELDAASQLDKVLEEADELADALHDGDADHACREAWDVIQAAEGVLRKHPEEAVRLAHAAVMLRCSRRGDYGEISDIE